MKILCLKYPNKTLYKMLSSWYLVSIEIINSEFESKTINKVLVLLFEH